MTSELRAVTIKGKKENIDGIHRLAQALRNHADRFFHRHGYTVELEKDLSLKKQFLDVVIIERKEGRMPDGLENMAAHNLISYKSLHEPFDCWSATVKWMK